MGCSLTKSLANVSTVLGVVTRLVRRRCLWFVGVYRAFFAGVRVCVALAAVVVGFCVVGLAFIVAFNVCPVLLHVGGNIGLRYGRSRQNNQRE